MLGLFVGENKLINLIQNVVSRCTELKDIYVEERDLVVDWVCIFSQSEEEYQELNRLANEIGEVVETTETGLIYKFGEPKLLKIRMPDMTRPEIGDVDFITNYPEFKQKYLNNNRFKLIVREKFEMIELTDPEFNVRVYFSSIPPSRLRNL